MNQANSKFEHSISHFEEELKKLRAGRPTPDMFSNIQVEAYGSMQRLEGVGAINIVDATLVTVQPWDKSLVGAVEKAIRMADMGFNPQVDSDLIRIPIPPLNQEKREMMIKKLHEMAEEARISIRVVRKDVMSWLDNEKKEGNLSEDELKGEQKKLQEIVDKSNKQVEDLVKAKEEVLRTV